MDHSEFAVGHPRSTAAFQYLHADTGFCHPLHPAYFQDSGLYTHPGQRAGQSCIHQVLAGGPPVNVHTVAGVQPGHQRVSYAFHPPGHRAIGFAPRAPLVEGDFRLRRARLDLSHYVAPPPAPERQPFAVSPRFNVHVATDGDAEVIAPRTRAFVALASQLAGDLNEPRVRGSIRSKRGSVNLPTAHFRLDEAEVAFGLAPPQPFTATGKAVLNSRLRGSQGPDKRAQAYVVTATVTIRYPQGDQEKPIVMELAAQPFLEESEIYRLLTRQDVIQGIIERRGDVEATIKQEAMQYITTALQPQIVEPVERAIADALGLSEFSIMASLEEPVEVKLGKYLVKGLRVSYSRAVSARETRFKFKVDYEVIKQMSLSWSTDQQRSRTMGLEANFRF